MSYTSVIDTPIGRLGITVAHDRLAGIDFHVDTALLQSSDAVAREVISQLRAYFKDSTWRFDLPMVEQGTPFQRRVWQALCDIPMGAPLSYGALAQELKSAPRAIGQACRTNPTPIVVPCHRIVAKHGLGGFAGKTLGLTIETKRWLLGHEGYCTDGS